jgi:aryl-alcohol dehydrogenase-like predicted oxidoreductase
LEENIGSVDVELSAEDLKNIDEAVSKIDIKGNRYPEQMQKMADAE